jgi:DNA-binding CsgD family transcriptional regulator
VAPTIAGYQDNTDLLVMARALDAARRSGPAAAAEAMDVLLDFGYGQLIPRHLWMPALVRFAQAAGDGERVAAALTVCETEAAKEIPAARAATALRWCTALAEHDPAAMLDVVRHHGELGRHVEMAEALADAAVLLAEQGELDRAERACDDALAVFGGLRASVDGSGLRTRLAAYGIHRPDTSAGQPNLLGWQLLSEAEREVAGLVAAGNSNADVSARLAIARREVQYHLSSALRKLGFDSRAELAEKVTAAR